MSKGGLKQTEFEFTILVGAITQIKTKHPAKFYLTWKIIHENNGKEIVGDEYICSNNTGVLSFSTEMKVSVKIIFNKDTNTYLKKKSMLCLNYIHDSSPNQSKLAGFVTIDLATLVTKGNNTVFEQYTLERSQFKKSSVTLKIISRKLKQQLINSFNWESKEMSIDSLFDKTNDKTYDKTHNHHDKKSHQPRKNIAKMKDQLNSSQKCNTQTCQQPMKQLLERQKLENLIRQLRQENEDLLNKVQSVQKQNDQLREFSQHTQSELRLKTLQEELAEIEDPKEQQNHNYQMMLLENQNILNEMEKVTRLITSKDKEIHSLKLQMDKLKRKDKRKQKKSTPESIELQEQMTYLSEEVMRLHEELANHRQTEVENKELTKEKQRLEAQISQYKTDLQNKEQMVNRQQQIINHLKYQFQKKEQSTFDLQNSSFSFHSTQKHDQNSCSRASQSMKGGLSDITSKTESNNNTKISNLLPDIQKLKNIPLNGMPSESKKSFLQIVKRLDSKLQQSVS